MLRRLLDEVVRALRRPPPKELMPGQGGRHATTEATEVGHVVTSYNPDTDGDPDPGEIVWTWVPYQDDPTRGKDRPVLVVARENAGTVLAVQLSSQERDDGQPGWLPIGSGGWDAERRDSWVDLTRILRVHPEGMRREAAALARDRFDQVIERLQDRYGWS